MGAQSNSHVIDNVLTWLDQGEQVWLCTITKTWGSSPSPAGTMMAYCCAFGLAGSLSGGCIEEDLIEKMKTATLIKSPENSYPVQLIYGDTTQEQQRFSLPCGGQLHLLVELLSADENTIVHFNTLKTQLEQRQVVGRRIFTKTGSMKIVTQSLTLGIKEVFDPAKADNCIEHVMGPVYQMLLIGASEVARCVAELAKLLDFKVAVWDHREEFIRNWHVENVTVYTGSPEKLIREKFCDEHNAIIALAHDPRVDDFALVDALATKAFYIGAIGSTKTCANRRERLKNYLEEPASLQLLQAPVGLSIGSKTPHEIAISILAEVILKKSQREKCLI